MTINVQSLFATTQLESKVDLAFTGCAALQSSQFIYDKACVETFYNNHPMNFTSLPEWQAVIKKPVEDRLVVATEEMIQFMTLDNLLWDFPYENIKPASDPQLIAAAQKALNELPAPLTKYINEHFYGFMLVSGVGWTGFASSVLETTGVPLKPGAVIIINADNIQNRTLNEWLAFREETAFVDSKSKLSMSYARPGEKSTLTDNLRHFLIHETAHLIVNAVPSIHPAFKYRNKAIPFTEFQKWSGASEPLDKAFPFLTYAWILTEGQTATSEPAYLASRNVPAYLDPVLKNKAIKFYSTDESAKFTDREAFVIYKHLNSTCFSSLYAMVDYTEDFAETVTHYFMSHKEGNVYSVDLVKTGKKDKVLTTFVDDLWNDPKCQDKVQFMEDLFNN